MNANDATVIMKTPFEAYITQSHIPVISVLISRVFHVIIICVFIEGSLWFKKVFDLKIMIAMLVLLNLVTDYYFTTGL